MSGKIVSLDREIASKYTQYLLSKNIDDSPDARKSFCDAEGIHPKLLYFNPSLDAVKSIAGHSSNLERLGDMTLREYMMYHFYYLHQGYRYGHPEMQQTWLGHPIVKSPLDCWIYQELIHSLKPDYVIELGVLFGGGSRFFCSLCDLVGHGTVIGVDITLDKVKDLKHPRLKLIEGSSVEQSTFDKVKDIVGKGTVLVIADSDHEKNHVYKELKLYSSLVTVGSYLIAEDTMNDVFGYHPVPNEGPQAAVRDFLAQNSNFEPDVRIAERYIITINPLGYLKRVS